MPVKIFFCYAHEDEKLLKKLKAHLKPLQRQELIDMWHDRDISAGTEWEQEISERLNAAQIILLLISPDFMASDYCYGTEMKRALERHNRKEARVIPVILRPVYWQDILGNIEALPTDAKPVTSPHWHTLDEAFLDVIEGILRTLQELREQPSTGEVPSQDNSFSHDVIPTGFEDLDRIMGGGFQRSDLIIVSAPPSTGKTSFALSIVLNTAIKYSRSVGIFSLEMSKKRLVQRLVSLEAHINQQLLQTGILEDEEWERVVYAFGTISEANIWIIDSANITASELLRQAHKMVDECKVSLIIVDYINLMQTEVNHNFDISRFLKVMARQLNVAVLALVQLPRLVATRRSKVPQLSDMDNAFEKDADIVMFIYRDDVYNPETERRNIADIIVAKHRHGPVGETSLYFRPDIGYFHDLEFAPSKEDLSLS